MIPYCCQLPDWLQGRSWPFLKKPVSRSLRAFFLPTAMCCCRPKTDPGVLLALPKFWAGDKQGDHQGNVGKNLTDVFARRWSAYAAYPPYKSPSPDSGSAQWHLQRATVSEFRQGLSRGQHCGVMLHMVGHKARNKVVAVVVPRMAALRQKLKSKFHFIAPVSRRF